MCYDLRYKTRLIYISAILFDILINFFDKFINRYKTLSAVKCGPALDNSSVGLPFIAGRPNNIIEENQWICIRYILTIGNSINQERT